MVLTVFHRHFGFSKKEMNMFSRYSDIFDNLRASHRVASALNNGRKPNHKDLRTLGVSEERIKSDFS